MKKPDNCSWTFALKWSKDFYELTGQKRGYNIHGLWPEELKKRNSESDSVKIQEELPKHLEKALEIVWNSDLHKPFNNKEDPKDKEIDRKNAQKADEKFWEHEWKKHGAYSGMSLVEYFTRAYREYEKRKNLISSINEEHQLHFYLSEDFSEISNDLIKG